MCSHQGILHVMYLPHVKQRLPVIIKYTLGYAQRPPGECFRIDYLKNIRNKSIIKESDLCGSHGGTFEVDVVKIIPSTEIRQVGNQCRTEGYVKAISHGK